MELFVATTLLLTNSWIEEAVLPVKVQLMGKQLEWNLYYQTSQLNSDYNPYGSHSRRNAPRPCRFKLVNHVNTLSSVSYSLDWMGLGFPNRVEQYQLNAWYNVDLPPGELRFPLKIKLGSFDAPPENSRALSKLYNADSADVEVHCGKDLVVKAHKTILAAHSDTLRILLTNATCSSEEGKREIVYIADENVKPAILEDVVKWMYLQNIEDTAQKVHDLLKAADYLQIAGLKEICGLHLVSSLAKENCLELLNLAYKYDIKNLKRLCIDLFVPNRKEILQQTSSLAEVIQDLPALVVELLGLEEVEQVVTTSKTTSVAPTTNTPHIFRGYFEDPI